MRIGPRDADFTGLERLAQRIEHRPLEFGKLVEEQHTEMRHADFARTHLQPATDQRRHRGAVMRRAKWSLAGHLAAFQRPRDRSDHRYFQRFGGRQGRQDSRQAGREQGFPRSRRPVHQQIVPAGCGNFQRPLGGFLPLHVLEVRPIFGFRGSTGFRRRQDRLTLEMIEQRQQVTRRQHFHIPGPCRFRTLQGRADQAEIPSRGMKRRQQHARGGGESPVQRQLANHDIACQRLGIDNAHGAKQRQRDRQVIVGARLRQIGGRQIDRDPLGRQRKPHRRDRGAHPLAALRDRLVRQTDHVEGGQAGCNLTLHLDAARLQSEIGHRLNQRHHHSRPNCMPGTVAATGGRVEAQQPLGRNRQNARKSAVKPG